MFEDLQKIIIYINADSTVGVIVDQYGQATSAMPVVIRSGEVLLCLRLLQDTLPYPAEKLTILNSFDCIFDNDWNTATTPKLRADNSNIAIVSTAEYTEIQIPLLNTNTEELAAIIENQQSVILGMELCGFVDGKIAPVFVLQVEGVKIQNRRGNSGMGQPTPVEPNVYTISQINLLLDDKSNVNHDHDGTYQHENISAAYNRAASVLASMMMFVRNGAVNAYLTINDIKEWLAGYFSGVDHNHDGTYAVPGDIPEDLSELSDATGIILGKADVVHNHPISQVDGLQAALDSKTNEAYVDTAVANIVNSSPAALDTLKELAAALGNDPNFAATITNLIATKADIDHTHDTAQVQPDVIYFTSDDLNDGKLEIQPAIFQVFDDVGNNIIPSVDFSGETMLLDFSVFGTFSKPWKILLINSFITRTFTAADLTGNILTLPGEVYPVFFDDSGQLSEVWNSIQWSGGNTQINFEGVAIENMWKVIYYAPRQLKVDTDSLTEIAINEHAIIPCVIDADGFLQLPNIALNEHKNIINIAGFGLTGTCIIPTEKGVAI